MIKFYKATKFLLPALIVVFAQLSIAADIPENSKPKILGNGWECISGFKKIANECIAVEIPPNAKLNFYGNGWECISGFKKIANECIAVEIPPNAKLNFYGNGWECISGFKKISNGCIPMSKEEIKQMEVRENAIMATIAARRASLASGNSCETESRTGAEVCLRISRLDFDCSKNAFGDYYSSCEATISYNLETNFKGRDYLDVTVECRVEIEYSGKGFYSTRSDFQTKDESSSLYANGLNSETMRFNFSFSSFEEVYKAKSISQRCEIDNVNLH